MSRMERIMGIPQETKKPSSLRNPRDPPAPRYINKQAAVDIARKLKLTSIGKVGLRITNATSIESEMMSKYSNKESTREMSQKSIMDRRKGLEAARNIVESRVGKCIMETNDYEVRRFNREFQKLLVDENQKKRQMTQKKKEFVNQKQKAEAAQTLTRADGRKSPVVPPTSDGERHAPHLPNIYPVGATQQQAREMVSQDRPRTESRGKSPGYMRPLSCTRDKSHDSAVGETERFLSSPYMRAYLSNIKDEEMTNRVLDGITEANENRSRDRTPPKSRSTSAKAHRSQPIDAEDVPSSTLPPPSPQEVKRPVSQGMSLSKLLLTKRLHEIQEKTESSSSSRQDSPVPPKTENDKDGEQTTSVTKNNDSQELKDKEQHSSEPVKDEPSSTEPKPGDPPLSKPPSRGKFLVELIKSEFSSKPGSPAILVESFKSDGDRSATPNRAKRMAFASIAKRISSTGEDGTDSPVDGNKKKKANNSLTVAAQIALLRTRTTSRKKRRAKKQAMQYTRSLQVSDRKNLMEDPRFTRLADSLIPDSDKATDLYKSEGKFTLPDHVAASFKSSQSRTTDSKFRQSRNLQNLSRFETLLNSI